MVGWIGLGRSNGRAAQCHAQQSWFTPVDHWPLLYKHYDSGDSCAHGMVIPGHICFRRVAWPMELARVPAINDYLLRALDRGHISRQEYEAGRDWQALESDAAAGNPAAKDKLDALDLDSKCSLGWKRHQLIRDVLLCEEFPEASQRACAGGFQTGIKPDDWLSGHETPRP